MPIKQLTPQEHEDNLSAFKTSFIDGLTPAQIDTYIDNNVVDLASAREALKKIAKITLYLANMV